MRTWSSQVLGDTEWIRASLEGRMGVQKGLLLLAAHPQNIMWSWDHTTVYPKKYAHGFCFAVLCCGYTLTDFPISIWLTSLALWQSNDCPSASKAILMNMDKWQWQWQWQWNNLYCQVTYRSCTKERSGRNNIHEIYKTWQRGLEAIVAYVPQYQLYQADCLGSAEQKQCRVLELFQYKTRSFMRMYTHIYTSYGKHVHIHVHVYTSIHRESIITIDASMY